jgi:hypothetical protein
MNRLATRGAGQKSAIDACTDRRLSHSEIFSSEAESSHPHRRAHSEFASQFNGARAGIPGKASILFPWHLGKGGGAKLWKPRKRTGGLGPHFFTQNHGIFFLRTGISQTSKRLHRKDESTQRPCVGKIVAKFGRGGVAQ